MCYNWLRYRGVRKMGISLILLAFVAISLPTAAQTIPLGQWQSHFSYLSARQVVNAGNKIYCSSYNGLFSVNVENNEIRTLSKSDGFGNTGVAAMAYQATQKLLLVAYRSGDIDFAFLDANFEPEEIVHWPLLNTTAGLPADKAISRIVFKDQFAYIATGFGIVVLDTELRQVKETYRYIGSNGTQVKVTDLAFSGDSLYAVSADAGLLATSMQANVNRQYFANWKTIATPGKVNSIATFSGAIYAAIPGKGIFRYSNGSWKTAIASESNALRILAADDRLTFTTGSSIITLDDLGNGKNFNAPIFSSVRSAIATGPELFWLADQQNGLLTNASGDFKSVTPAQGDTTISPRPDSTITDLNGLSWTKLPDIMGNGILVSDKTGTQKRVLSTSVGNGSLPASKINSLAVDLDGYIWFASATGVGYLSPENVLGASRVDAILPVFGQRRLFSNEECTALAVEPGNRKWIGTRNGLYLFNADGTEMTRKFTSADSPLPSDIITALRFDAQNGLLFVDTPAGMVSYRADAVAQADNPSAITIFPNPVRPGFSGTVGFNGLSLNSTVKVTDLSGRLIYETRSQGGIASWNLNDYTGRRARGGIYLVFAVSEYGAEKLAGKLAIIE